MKTKNERTVVSCVVAILAATSLLISNCAAASQMTQSAEKSAETTMPRVFFSEPADDAMVRSPLMVKMRAENFVVETTENGVSPGKGHLHIMVDSDCIAAGNGIPKDETHLHYGKGQLEAELTLAPGAHTLCLQAADGNHIALEGKGMTHVVKVTVK